MYIYIWLYMYDRGYHRHILKMIFQALHSIIHLRLLLGSDFWQKKMQRKTLQVRGSRSSHVELEQSKQIHNLRVGSQIKAIHGQFQSLMCVFLSPVFFVSPHPNLLWRRRSHWCPARWGFGDISGGSYGPVTFTEQHKLSIFIALSSDG